MFGRKRRAQEAAFADQTVDYKYGLMDAIEGELTRLIEFDGGARPASRQALRDYCSQVRRTDNVVFNTLNSLPLDIQARAKNAAGNAVESRDYNTSAGSPLAQTARQAAYLAHNGLIGDLFETDFMGEKTDQTAADDAFAMGAMVFATSLFDQPGRTMLDLNHCVSVGCILGAGWMSSPQRRRLA